MKFQRFYTTPDVDVFDMFEWKKLDVIIKNNITGEMIFEGKDLEFPQHYNQNACDIIAKMYFRKSGVPGTGHEVSMKQVVSRMANFWVKALVHEKVIDKENSIDLYDEIRYIMLKQLWAPNTPQWFNTGLYHSYGIEGNGTGSFYWDPTKKKVVECKNGYERTPASACFITTVKDSLLGDQSLSENLTTATRLFSYGSGIGSNWSYIRGEGEALSGGGVSSGVMSFLKVFDKNAGAIKSGGMHRRASVLNALDMDHPDIVDFIRWKSIEEDKVRALGKMGYDTSMNGEAYETVSGQNCNNSVCIPDAFMELLDVPGAKWKLKGRVDSSKDKEVLVEMLWHEICKAAWECGDPGVQFNDVMNDWNTCANSGRIRSTNPCFTYDTKLLTDKGYFPIGSLCDKEFDLVRPDGKIVSGRVWKSGYKETIKLVMDDDTVIRCTPDHKFMISDGSMVEAKDLLDKELKFFTDEYINSYSKEYHAKGLNTNIDSIDSMQSIEKACDIHDGSFYGENDYRIRGFIRGLFDAHAEIKDNQIILNSKNRNIVYSISRYMESHGIKSDITSTLSDSIGTVYMLIIKQPMSIVKFYGNIGHRDNVELSEILKTLTAPKVVKIVPSTVEAVYDFFEKETHLGVVEGFVVHNCSEFVFLDDNACNLSSINLLPFYKYGKLDYDGLIHVATIATLVMEATAHWGCYPTMQIAENTYKFRPLGLGITNLGALLMKMGLPYDSDVARDISAFLMSILTAQAYNTSADIANDIGAFDKFEENKGCMLKVMHKHYQAFNKLVSKKYSHDMIHTHRDKVDRLWTAVLEKGNDSGYRNAAVTLIPPAGTISFALGCDSTGLEPFFSNIVYKKVADGSFMSMTNEVIEDGLRALDYSDDEIKAIIAYINENHGMIEGAPYLKETDLPVFDTANKNGKGQRFISPLGHLKMVAALQPHMSMSSSKTTNVPNEITIEEIGEIYKTAWKLGCKCVALYRDGCKATQPLNTTIGGESSEKSLEDLSYKDLLEYAKTLTEYPKTAISSTTEIRRERLPFEPKSIKNEIQMDDQTFHIIRSFYDDGRLGEIFVTVGKNGSTVKGLQEVLCMIISKALQYGVPADVLAKTMRHHEFSPNGFVYNHPFIKSASSIPDLMSKFLDISYGNYQYCQVKPNTESKNDNHEEVNENNTVENVIKPPIEGMKFEAVFGERCSECGSTKIVKAGVCKYCQACGTSTGCS